MTTESSLDVRDRYLLSTLDQEVTPDHHQAARRENNSNWCHYAKTKTRLEQPKCLNDPIALD